MRWRQGDRQGCVGHQLQQKPVRCTFSERPGLKGIGQRDRGRKILEVLLPPIHMHTHSDFKKTCFLFCLFVFFFSLRETRLEAGEKA